MTDSQVPIRERMEALVRRKQQEITKGLETLDTVKFQADSWDRGNNCLLYTSRCV